MSKKTSDQLLPLRGKLKCSKCDAKLTGSRSRGKLGGHYAYYHCNHCRNERHRADLINQVMEEVLDSAKLNSRLDRLVEAICADLLTADSSQTAAKVNKLKQTVSKQNDRIQRLQDNLADGVVSSDDYMSMKTRFSKELNEAQNELNHLKAHDSSKESIIRKAVEALNNLGVNYRNSSADRKIKLVGSIFPEMIEFDGNKCRTPKINEAAALCFNVDGRLRGNKKGTLHQKMEVSLLVARRGIEPLLPG
ncbi:MAG: zinc ribbon domain-containing protein [Flavobacteriales bacterium]|nr:zinc ribbon domain-containing protein [Flavobacteriales bacterium]